MPSGTTKHVVGIVEARGKFSYRRGTRVVDRRTLADRGPGKGTGAKDLKVRHKQKVGWKSTTEEFTIEFTPRDKTPFAGGKFESENKQVPLQTVVAKYVPRRPEANKYKYTVTLASGKRDDPTIIIDPGRDPGGDGNDD